MAPPLLDFYRAEKISVFANVLELPRSGLNGLAPKVIVHSEAESVHALEWRRRGFVKLSAKIRVGDLFKGCHAVGQPAYRPGLMYEKTLPVPRQDNEDKSDDDANGERHPKNIHQLTFQFFTTLHSSCRTVELYYKNALSPAEQARRKILLERCAGSSTDVIVEYARP
jgi:hypothetical protein